MRTAAAVGRVSGARLRLGGQRSGTKLGSASLRTGGPYDSGDPAHRRCLIVSSRYKHSTFLGLVSINYVYLECAMR